MWQSVVINLLSVTSILSIIAVIRFWNQNKKLKDNEVKIKDSEATVSNVDAQKAQIELGALFNEQSANMFQMMKDLQERTYAETLKNGTDNESIMKQLDSVVAEQKRHADQLKNLTEEQAHMVMYFNGEYQDFLKRNGFKK